MDSRGFQSWLDRYVDAWKTYDESAISELFSEDAKYRYHPWDDPVVGREAIVASWLEEQDDAGSWTAVYQPWIVAEDGAVAVGVSRYLGADRSTVEREYHNVFLCRFDDAGRCREFTELFMRRDTP